jgi:glycosyltransferase involved in cell wall biosynthesis
VVEGAGWSTYREARQQWLRDLVRDATPTAFAASVRRWSLRRNFRRTSTGCTHISCIPPPSVTRYAAMLKQLPWSGSAHAKDIWTIPEWEKREKLASCAWLVTCTAANRDHLAALAPPGRVELVYHGLDLCRFSRLSSEPGRRDGRDPADPVVILSAGRWSRRRARMCCSRRWRVCRPACTGDWCMRAEARSSGRCNVALARLVSQSA